MELLSLKRHRVYDPVLRGLHAWNALLISLLLLSGQWIGFQDYGPARALLWHAHIVLGYGLLLGWCARLAWGFVGPFHARWASLWHPAIWRDTLLVRRRIGEATAFGHHPQASAAYLAVYAVLGVMLASGLLLAASAQNTGPLYPWFGHEAVVKSMARIPHSFGQYFLWLFLFVHLTALILHERRHGVPIAQAMVSGYQYLKEKS